MVKANECEVLAPAGRTSDILPLIEAGADAIYVGLSGYSARPKSSDFSSDDIRLSLSLTKEHGKKLYVAINANVENDKLDGLCEEVASLDALGVDAFIVSDYGLINRLSATVKNAQIHASTLTGVYNYEDVKLLKEMGVCRIILSSDLFVDEIVDIIDNVGDMDYEIVADGGICFNSNRQCLLPHVGSGACYSVYCQRDYDLLKDGKFVSKARRIGNNAGKLHRTMGIYLGMGIGSFKIEGRTNSFDYILKRVKDMVESKKFFAEHQDEIAGMMHYIRRCN